jgi:anti-sigma factor RsiW
MKDVQDHELSGLLDGELSPARALEVRAAIGADPALRSEYESIARLDARLSELAEGAAFAPEVSLPLHDARQMGSVHWLAIVAIVLALMAIRFLPKLADLSVLGLGLGLQLMAGAIIVFQIVRMAHDTAPSGPVAARGV